MRVIIKEHSMHAPDSDAPLGAAREPRVDGKAPWWGVMAVSLALCAGPTLAQTRVHNPNAPKPTPPSGSTTGGSSTSGGSTTSGSSSSSSSANSSSNAKSTSGSTASGNSSSASSSSSSGNTSSSGSTNSSSTPKPPTN